MRALLSLFALVSTSAFAGQLTVVSSAASSTYAETPGYEVSKATDGKATSVWVEGDEGSGLGAWMELDFGSDQKVTQVRIWGGDWTSWNDWQRANRPKEVELKFADDTTQVITLKDEKVAQTFDVPGGKSTRSLRLRFKSVYAGSAWFDTGIAEVQVFGDGGVERVTGTVTASSTAPEDGDGNYQPVNVLDGLVDSMWCEGDPGDGTGQWLQVDFGTARSVSKFSFINGIGTSMPLWIKANQATGLRLTFDDGTSADVPIERPSYKTTTVDVAPHTTKKVKISVTGVKPGKEFNDLCLSEVGFPG